MEQLVRKHQRVLKEMIRYGCTGVSRKDQQRFGMLMPPVRLSLLIEGVQRSLSDDEDDE